MTLEHNIERIAAALEQLVTIAQSGAAGVTELTAAPATKGKEAWALLPGDPEGTQYWLQEKNKQAIKTPNDSGVDPRTIDGFELVPGAHWAKKKAEFEGNATAASGKRGRPAGQTASPAATPAASTSPAPATSPAASPASSSPASTAHKDVVNALMELGKKDKAQIFEVLGMFLPGVDKANLKVSLLEPLNKSSEIMAEINRRINPELAAPAAAAEVDPFA